MLFVKKARSGELLELALLLGLLRVHRNVDLNRFDVPLVRVGPRDSWDAPVHPLDNHYPNPKSVDSLLSRYDRSVLYDINLLGRYTDAISLNRDVTAYVGLAGDEFPPTPEFYDDFEDERFSFSELDSPGGWSSDGDGAAEKEDPEESAEQRPGDELTPEDMELIEVLWKQDVDMGFSLAEFQETPAENAVAAPGGEPPSPPSVTSAPASPAKTPKSPPLLEVLRIKEENSPEPDPWEGLSYTVDLETGEYILKEETEDTPLVPETEPSADLLDEDFSLEDALQLVGLNDDTFQVSEEGSEVVDPEDLDRLSEMLQVQVPSQPGQYHHSRQLQNGQHQNGVGQMGGQHRWRGGNGSEQRWQDLAQLLALPQAAHVPPAPEAPVYHQAGFSAPSQVAKMHDQHHHHHHSFGPTPVHQRGGPILGSATMNGMHSLTNSSEPMGGEHVSTNFKVENPNDILYYQNNGSDPNHDGFSSLLAEDDFLMDVAMNEGMYSMRMLEGTNAANGATDSDSAVSSMGSERVPSLASDTSDWMETNSDSGHTPADHFMATSELHSKYRWFDYNYFRQHSGDSATNSGGGRLPPQKKYQLYGKRGFHEQQPSSSNNPSSGTDAVAGPSSTAGGTSSGAASTAVTAAAGTSLATAGLPPPPPLTLLKHEYSPLPAPSYIPVDMAAKPQPELKYSATLDFARQSLYGIRPPLPDNVVHNHTYCMPPEHSGALQRPLARDKKELNSDDEDDDCAGVRDPDGQQLTRDERRARALQIPIQVADIINLPMDEFNERLSKHDLSEPQLSLIRDIRRRGKNKVAAQNCRKRKLDQILSLADEVKIVREKKQKLLHEREILIQQRHQIKTKVSILYRHIFQSLRDEDGNPVNAYQWTLQQTPDGSIALVPRHDTNTTTPHRLDHDPTKP